MVAGGDTLLDKLSVMNAFCRIVERGSFARAAEDLGVSPALLSREVKLLEDALGATLLARTTRRMAPTEDGKLYYDEARAILSAVGRLEERLRSGAKGLSGHLKVNVSSSFGQTVIAPMLPAFLDAHPDLTVTLALDDRVVDLVEGGFDVSIRIRAAMPDSTLKARRIGVMRQRIYAAPGYLDRRAAPVAPQDLADHPIIGFLVADHLTSWTITGPEGTVTIPLAPRLRVGTSLVLRDLLVAGAGIGTLPDFVARDPLARGDLLRVLPDYELPARDIFAVTAARLGLDPRARAFCDAVETALAQNHS